MMTSNWKRITMGGLVAVGLALTALAARPVAADPCPGCTPRQPGTIARPGPAPLPSPSPGHPKPDLFLASIYSTVTQDTVTVMVWTKNLGGGPAGPSLVGLKWEGSTSAASFDVFSGLEPMTGFYPGHWATFTYRTRGIPLLADAGKQAKFCVTADALNEVDEVNEGNNTKCGAVTLP